MKPGQIELLDAAWAEIFANAYPFFGWTCCKCKHASTIEVRDKDLPITQCQNMIIDHKALARDKKAIGVQLTPHGKPGLAAILKGFVGKIHPPRRRCGHNFFHCTECTFDHDAQHRLVELGFPNKWNIPPYYGCSACEELWR
jgi:hypothetical protein